MSWLRKDKQGSGDARVEAIRWARLNQGHEQTVLQEDIVRSIAAVDPVEHPNSRQAFCDVVSAIEASGRWQEYEEWRISTSFDSSIVEGVLNERKWFTTTVSCDGQTLSCGCPSIERAYGFMRLYQRMIVDQFYSVGPPWADQNLFQK